MKAIDWSSLPALTVLLGATSLLLPSHPALAKERVEERMEKTYALGPEGRLSLNNINGSIEIQAWDRNEVELVAVKSAESQEQLDALTIKVDASAHRLSIETKYPKGKWRWNKDTTRVDYTLRAPAGIALDKITSVNGSVAIEMMRGRIEASTVNGALTTTGLAGDIELSTVNGTVKAGFASLQDVKSIDLQSVNGTITLTLPGDASADLEFSSVNGRISTAFEVSVTKHWPVGRDLTARLGEGGTKVKATTVNGAIRLERAKAP